MNVKYLRLPNTTLDNYIHVRGIIYSHCTINYIYISFYCEINEMESLTNLKCFDSR